MGTLSLTEFECEIRVQVLDVVSPTKKHAMCRLLVCHGACTAGVGFHEFFESRRFHEVLEWSYHACDDVRGHR